MDLVEVLSVSSFNIKGGFGASVGPWTILRDENSRVKVGGLVQKLHFLEILKMQNFAWTCPILRATYIFSALPGAARCALASSYGRDVACGDDSFFVSRNRTSNIFSGGGSKQNFSRKENPRHGDTFWFITFVPLDGFG